MHDTALIAGESFFKVYGKPGMKVADIGGLDVNGSLKPACLKASMEYICVDIEKHPSVDIVIKPGDKLPFENQSIDLIVSTSCLEHDPCFWLTFKEITRVIKPNGHIYLNVPSNGVYHKHPDDNWRFNPGAAQALAYWSGIQIANEEVFPVCVIESFNILPLKDIWTDFVAVFGRTDVPEKEIVLSDVVKKTNGKLKQALRARNVKIEIKM